MAETIRLIALTATSSSPAPAGRSGTVTALIIAVAVIVGIAFLLFFGLIVLRLIGSRRERKFLEKKEHLNPLVYDLLTEDRSVSDVVATLKSVVPARDRRVLEQVLLENIRFLKGREQEALTGVFDEMGFADEDIADLGRRGTVRKAEAAYHLGTMRSEKAVTALIRTLRSTEHPEVVFTRLNALSKIGTREALEAVVDHLSTSPELETLRVAEVILECKQEFSDYLEDWLEHGEPDTDRLILLVNIIGAMKDAEAVPLLTRFLKHTDGRVRARAAFSLGAIGDFTVSDVLMEAMDDPEAEVRAEAAEALGKLQYEPAMEKLRGALDDEDLSVRLSSATALSQLGDEGRAVLQEALLTTEETQAEAIAEVLGTMEVREGEEGGEGV